MHGSLHVTHCLLCWSAVASDSLWHWSSSCVCDVLWRDWDFVRSRLSAWGRHSPTTTPRNERRRPRDSSDRNCRCTQVAFSHLICCVDGASTVVSVVNKLDRRRVLLTTRLTCSGDFLKSEFGTKLRNYSYFWSYPNFLKTPCRISGKSILTKKARSAQTLW